MKRLTGLKAVVGKRLTEIFPAVKDEALRAAKGIGGDSVAAHD